MRIHQGYTLYGKHHDAICLQCISHMFYFKFAFLEFLVFHYQLINFGTIKLQESVRGCLKIQINSIIG